MTIEQMKMDRREAGRFIDKRDALDDVQSMVDRSYQTLQTLFKQVSN
jgi:hypothetical protein